MKGRTCAGNGARPVHAAMSYHVRDNLGFCVVDGRTIFLDLEADRYFSLGLAADEAFQLFLADRNDTDDLRAALTPLVEKGVLVVEQAGASRQGRAELIPPTSELPLRPSSEASGMMIARAGLAQIVAAAMIRCRSLPSIDRSVQAHRKATVARQHDAEPTYAAITAAIGLYEPIFGAVDKCLIRSLAFLWLAARQGLAPKLVFGVQVRPFAAHCWVEEAGLVVNDRLENVQPFTPILVI